MQIELGALIGLLVAVLLAVIVWLWVQNRRLQLTGEQFRRLADSAHDLIWIINTRGRFVYVNSSSINMLGYEPEELLGKPLDLITTRGSATASYNEISHVLRTGALRYSRTELKYVRRDGSVFWVELSINLRRDHTGRITALYGIARDVDEQHHLRREMYQLAHYDNLTSLPNRTLFNDRLTAALSRARRQHWKVAVLYMDLDDFKRINDTVGHHEGDQVLEIMSARLKEAMRYEDTIARIGGDEFAALIEDVSGESTVMRICQKLSEGASQPITTAQGEHRVGLSIGYTLVDPSDAMSNLDVDAILAAADREMYIAKQKNKQHEPDVARS